MRTRAQFTERASPAQQAMTRAEGRVDEKLARLLDRRREMMTALRDYAAAADLALLGDLCRDTRDQMAAIYADARKRHAHG